MIIPRIDVNNQEAEDDFSKFLLALIGVIRGLKILERNLL